MGIDLESVLEGAGVAAEACTAYNSEGNSGLWVGLALAALAQQGRDKLTFVVDAPIESFGLWAEQLVAESLGKQGTGIVPVTDEPVGEPAVYGRDRVLCYLRDTEPSEALDDAVRALAADNQPVITLSGGGAEDLGRIFFFAEFATAVAGWALGINPFDQPDVQVAKDTTGKILATIAEGSDPPAPQPASDDELRALLADAEADGSYIALLGFMAPGTEVDEAVAELRTALRAATGATTTFGYGPRYLHSTGQLHKGGPDSGRFLVLVHDGPEDLEIPGKPFSFRALKNAQAAGDLETLRSRGRQAEFLRLEGDDIAAAVRGLTARIEELTA
jgi:hypothetical protein